MEGSELSNSEATYYESRTMKIETKQARKGLKAKHHLDMHSHAALKSFSNSGYTRVIEFTRDGKIKTEYQNGKIVGQKLSEFIVGMMQEPVIGGDPMTTIAELVYKDYNSFEHNAHVLIPDFDLGIYEGIYDVRFNIIESDPANIKMSAYTLDGNAVDNLQISDFVMKNTTGDKQIIDAMSFSEEEQAYVLTGAFMPGTIETNGVIVQSNIMYEGARIDLNL
ncbi:hypothetical protein [Aquimarina hainanensis]|uniref:hypothetical protein n=1 Tax=Aquimarina hainanensis TaxID=1578017 RepID=UPI0036146A29